jgi:dTDP-glucose pyrophosphorylase/predicted transcriptional regulator
MKDLKNTFITKETTIFKALEVLQDTAVGIALVVDENEHLLGVVTDGNIRRALLNKHSLETAVESFMETNPITISDDEPVTNEIVLGLFHTYGIRQIPVVNKENKLINLILEHEYSESVTKPNWAIIMSGGLGSRLKNLTKDIPKGLLHVGGKPILESIILSLKSFGIINIKLSVNYFSEQIIDYFGDGSSLGVNITYIKETKKLGTAGALSLLEEMPNEPFLVMNGDLLTNVNFASILDFHSEHDNCATMCIKDHGYEFPYGVVKLDKNHKFLALEEKPKMQAFINAGIYVLNPECLNYLPKNEHLNITDLFEILKNNDRKLGCFPIGEYWIDIGLPEDYKKANGEYSVIFKDKQK